MNKTPQSTYRIRFNDCDLFGHLNNSKYLDYFINAREDHLKQFYEFDLSEYYKSNLGWVVWSHEIAYVRPAKYNEMVMIQSSLLSACDQFLHFEAIMLDENQNHLKAIMRTKLIHVSTVTGKKELHSSDFLKWAKTIENQEANQIPDLQARIKQLTSILKDNKHYSLTNK
ncbi:acyl-CoA thioesterase [Flavobacterium sp. NG2]|uniref:acyl-CoA thioesterase n=1 Tax=Flavobacterium sp. NG2 TaxID=3097547 RepID=UPI002A7F9982|nr:acyl-CoA thioesterase [Flavobacterium sp. NG2]WPR70330.1 acyl-CoA thioesterase [Flavobacterium sp. NG2]